MPQRRVVTVPPEAAGARLDVLIAQHLGDVSRSRVAKLIASGAVRVNGGPQKPKHIARAGDIIEIIVPDAEPAIPLPERIPVSLLYEADDLVVVRSDEN